MQNLAGQKQAELQNLRPGALGLGSGDPRDCGTNRLGRVLITRAMRGGGRQINAFLERR